MGKVWSSEGCRCPSWAWIGVWGRSVLGRLHPQHEISKQPMFCVAARPAWLPPGLKARGPQLATVTLKSLCSPACGPPAASTLSRLRGKVFVDCVTSDTTCTGQRCGRGKAAVVSWRGREVQQLDGRAPTAPAFEAGPLWLEVSAQLVCASPYLQLVTALVGVQALPGMQPDADGASSLVIDRSDGISLHGM